MTSGKSHAHHVCPVWVGYLLASPVRALRQNPVRILSPYVSSGMRVMDIGCAMGFFSLPLARLVKPDGRVICVDLQQKMLDALERRARRARLIDWIERRRCGAQSLGVADLAGQIDFVLAFALVHEVPDTARFFSEIGTGLKPGARVLVAEPRGRVTEAAFRESVAVAESGGFVVVDSPKISRSHAVVLRKASSVRPAR